MLQFDRKIKISVANSRKATEWNTQELLWSAMVQKLAVPVRTTETLLAYKSLPKSKQDDLKDVGGFVGGELKDGKRRNGYSLNRHIITLDADNIPAGETQNIINAVDALGCAYAIYSTRKHEGAAPRLRILLPLDLACSPDEYEPIARKAASFLNLNIFDPTTFEPIRLMYWPSACIDSEYVYVFGDKPFLSKQGMLNLYADWRNIAEWPEVPGAARIRDRSAKKQGNPLDKQGVVGAFCKTYDVPAAIEKYLSGIYEPCDGDRYTYTEGSTVGGAILYDGGNFIYSHHATDPAGGKLCNAFDLVRLHLFQDKDEDAKPDTPVTNLQSFKAMCEFAMDDKDVSKIVSIERYERAQEEFKGASFSIDNTAVEKPDMDWLGQLKCSSQTGLPNKTIDNVVIILENDPELKDKFYHDEFGNRAVIVAPMPWEGNLSLNRYKQRTWSDEDDAGLRHYIEKVYTITGKERIYDAVAVYATARKKHKLKEYLETLKWDGIPRVDTLLIDYFGTEDTEYTRMVIRKTLTAAIARVMNPGVKFDNMLILSGPQGVGKSTFFSILGREWYSDSLATFEGKDASELIQGYWIIEAGELTGFNKSEMNAVKQFLSKKTDVYRVPYGRRTGEFPRSCIIVGTTNDKEFLKDRTGNRRFWPVDLGKHQVIKNVFTQLPEEVDQIWAEAFMRYRLGEKLYLDGAVAEEAIKQQEDHKESNPKEGIIKEFVSRKVPCDWNRRDLSARRVYWGSEFKDESLNVERDRICAAEVWCECFYGDLKLMRRSDAVEINAILSEMEGWERTQGALKFGSYYGAQKGFTRTP